MSTEVQKSLIPQDGFQMQLKESKVAEIPKEHRKHFDKLEGLLSTAAATVTKTKQSLLRTYYKVGLAMAGCISSIVKKHGDDEKAANEEMNRIRRLFAEALGLKTDRILYTAVNVVDSVPKEAYEEMCEQPQLSWQHITLLAGVHVDVRKKITAECVSNNWSSSELFEQIRSRFGPKKPRGKKPKGVPPSHRIAAQRMAKGTKKLRESFEEVWLGEKYDFVEEMACIETKDKVPEGLKADVDDAISEVESLANVLPSHLTRLREARDWIERAEKQPPVKINEAGDEIVVEDPAGDKNPVSREEPDNSQEPDNQEEQSDE